MPDTLFDVSEIPIVCGGCGEEIIEDMNRAISQDECNACYVNTDCPAECNEEHRAPDVTRDGETWGCPTTGAEYHYFGDANRNSGDWEPASDYDYPTLVEDYYYSREECFYCEGCDRDFHNDDYGEDGMCSRCAERESGHSIHDVDIHGHHTVCDGCRHVNGAIVAFHEMTEEAFCGQCATTRPGLMNMAELDEEMEIAA